MTRVDRLIAIACYIVVLVGLIGVAGANAGPIELLVVLALAVPVGMLIGRGGRALSQIVRQAA
jgi:hypothetical protein